MDGKLEEHFVGILMLLCSGESNGKYKRCPIICDLKGDRVKQMAKLYSKKPLAVCQNLATLTW
jgi:hypothetical protein